MAILNIVYRIADTVALRKPLTLVECQLVREWRNDPAVLPMLRTGHKTADEQERFYYEVICNGLSQHRYYALERSGDFVGMGGLTYLNRTPEEAEISLILGPGYRGAGYGQEAVDALLCEAFTVLGLEAVMGECYAKGAMNFWLKQTARIPVESHGIDANGTYSWRWRRP